MAGLQTQVWQAQVPTDAGIVSATATLAQLANLTGGRLPVGLGTARTPGPFQATWSATTSYTVATHGGSLVSAKAEGNRIAVLTGGGLTAPKTVSLGSLGTDWSTPADEDAAVVAAIAYSAQDRADRSLWRVWLPILLTAAAVATAVTAVRAGHSFPTNEERQHLDDESAHPDQIGVS